MVPVSEKSLSESVRCPKSLADLCPKIVRRRDVSENCPNINNMWCLLLMLGRGNDHFWVLHILSLDYCLFQKTINIRLTSLFWKKLLRYCVCQKLSHKISCCPSEYRIGIRYSVYIGIRYTESEYRISIRTISEFRSFGFRLVPAPLCVRDVITFMKIIFKRNTVLTYRDWETESKLELWYLLKHESK